MAQKDESAKSTREKAAEARAAAQAAERRRERTIRIVGGVAVLVVVLGILAIGIMQSKKNDAPPSADSPLPTGVTTAYGYGFPVNAADGVPTVEIFEDFQCPACANLEQAYGPLIQQEAEAGNIKLVYRPMVFLDSNLNTDHSLRAANAFGCAITGGVGEQYHSVVFANQPTQEGDGWTDDQLKAFGGQAGLTGDAQSTFEKCVDDGTYEGWSQLSNDAAFDAGVSGTPTIFVDGKELPTSALQSEKALKEALTNPQQ